MIEMKAFKKIIVASIFLAIVIYLTASFAEASFNMALWSRDLRAGYAGAYLSLLVLSALAIAMDSIKSN